MFFTNGRGLEVSAVIDMIGKRDTLLSVQSRTLHPKASRNIHVAMAPTKRIERYEWFLEKATEIGVTQFTPLLCDHSERKIIKKERLEKIIASAGKQSLKFHFPKLAAITTLKELVATEKYTHKFIAHCHELPKAELKNMTITKEDILILIGPEGDFSEKEVQFALDNGFESISLGVNRLRTETAGLYAACTLVNL